MVAQAAPVPPRVLPLRHYRASAAIAAVFPPPPPFRPPLRDRHRPATLARSPRPPVLVLGRTLRLSCRHRRRLPQPPSSPSSSAATVPPSSPAAMAAARPCPRLQSPSPFSLIVIVLGGRRHRLRLSHHPRPRSPSSSFVRWPMSLPPSSSTTTTAIARGRPAILASGRRPRPSCPPHHHHSRCRRRSAAASPPRCPRSRRARLAHRTAAVLALAPPPRPRRTPLLVSRAWLSTTSPLSINAITLPLSTAVAAALVRIHSHRCHPCSPPPSPLPVSV